MLTLSRTLIALACVVLAPRVCAQSLDLSIIGTILPGACTVELGGGGVIDLGTVLAEKLDPDEETSLGSVLVPMTVACQVPVRFAFMGLDNTGDTASVATRYGLGLSPDGEKIGGAVIRFKDPTSNGVPVHYTRSEDGGQQWEASSNAGTTWLGKASINGFSTTAGSVDGPDPMESLQTELEVRTYIQPTSALTIEGNVPINGRATIDLIYL
jgi:type 1 fimbria pilin